MSNCFFKSAFSTFSLSQKVRFSLSQKTLNTCYFSPSSLSLLRKKIELQLIGKSPCTRQPLLLLLTSFFSSSAIVLCSPLFQVRNFGFLSFRFVRFLFSIQVLFVAQFLDLRMIHRLIRFRVEISFQFQFIKHMDSIRFMFISSHDCKAL